GAPSAVHHLLARRLAPRPRGEDPGAPDSDPDTRRAPPGHGSVAAGEHRVHRRVVRSIRGAQVAEPTPVRLAATAVARRTTSVELHGPGRSPGAATRTPGYRCGSDPTWTGGAPRWSRRGHAPPIAVPRRRGADC